MPDFIRSVRYAARQLRRAPVFSIAAILTLALGIGGTTAIFTLIHAVMLRSLPVANPDRLYRIGDGGDCCVEGGPQDRWGMSVGSRSSCDISSNRSWRSAVSAASWVLSARRAAAVRSACATG